MYLVSPPQSDEQFYIIVPSSCILDIEPGEGVFSIFSLLSLSLEEFLLFKVAEFELS